jgi:hypothetical protein
MAKISDKIREWCNDAYSGRKIRTTKDLYALADRIDSEMVELPKDKDGRPIHVGDTVYLDDGRKAEVNRIAFTREKTSIDLLMCDKGSFLFSAAQMDITHTAPDSWERIAYDIETVVPIDDEDDERFRRELAHRIRRLAKEGE